MLSFLAPEERSVGDVVVALGLAQPSVSKHLRVLSEVDLVQARRDGRRILYRTNAAAIRPLHEWTRMFERYWSQQLRRIKDRAEAAHQAASSERKPSENSARRNGPRKTQTKRTKP